MLTFGTANSKVIVENDLIGTAITVAVDFVVSENSNGRADVAEVSTFKIWITCTESKYFRGKILKEKSKKSGQRCLICFFFEHNL